MLSLICPKHSHLKWVWPENEKTVNHKSVSFVGIIHLLPASIHAASGALSVVFPRRSCHWLITSAWPIKAFWMFGDLQRVYSLSLFLSLSPFLSSQYCSIILRTVKISRNKINEIKFKKNNNKGLVQMTDKNHSLQEQLWWKMMFSCSARIDLRWNEVSGTRVVIAPCPFTQTLRLHVTASLIWDYSHDLTLHRG